MSPKPGAMQGMEYCSLCRHATWGKPHFFFCSNQARDACPVRQRRSRLGFYHSSFVQTIPFHFIIVQKILPWEISRLLLHAVCSPMIQNRGFMCLIFHPWPRCHVGSLPGTVEIVICKYFPLSSKGSRGSWFGRFNFTLLSHGKCFHNGFLCQRVKPVWLCFFVVCCVVQPSLGMNDTQDLGVEETRKGIDKPSVEGTSRKDKSGWWKISTHPEEHQKGRHSPRDCMAEKGMLPSIGCVGVMVPGQMNLMEVSLAWMSH